jgi:hypothetical protein
MWIGSFQLLEGPLVESCLYGIGGFWRRSKSMWGSLLLHAPLETSKTWAFAGVFGPNSICDRR